MWKWMVSLLVCRGKHRCMMHFLGAKVWECSRCGRIFPIPESLTGASWSSTPETSKHTDKTKQHERSKVQNIEQFKTRKKGA